ncbi:DUF4142 domain-containing protein [Noviherbaspirillum denitrificans]|uniref:DUF4142 domain-containing protein n=1 Tax=Noviherbaspirillum denitrificans TaxID=1968433 RepID=UPI001F462F81|nr:DUF4142 domain-containing protein [Noviherbaspirillum denitrificans]
MQQRQILNRMFGVALLAMLFSVPGAQAQSAASSGSSGKASSSAQSGKSMSRGDQNIVNELAVSNLAEIEAGKIALSQSKNDQVRNFAQKMVDDHQQAQKDLEQLAQAKGMTLPTEPDNKHKAMAKKLSALEGDKFDKQYMKQGGLNDHKDTHKMLQSAQKRASDPDLKALVAKMEPVVSQHLNMAQDVSSMKNSASGSQGPAGTSASGTSSGSMSKDKTGVSGTSGSSNSATPGK